MMSMNEARNSTLAARQRVQEGKAIHEYNLQRLAEFNQQYQAAQAAGSTYTPPAGYVIRNGQVIKKPDTTFGSEWLARNTWVFPAAILGGGLAAGAVGAGAAGATAAGAGGAGAAGGAGGAAAGGTLAGTSLAGTAGLAPALAGGGTAATVAGQLGAAGALGAAGGAGAGGALAGKSLGGISTLPTVAGGGTAATVASGLGGGTSMLGGLSLKDLLGYGIEAGGRALSAYGQSKEADASREQQLLLAKLQALLSQYNTDSSQDFDTARLGAEMASAEAGRQQERQRQALLANILPGLRNAQVSPPGDLGRFTPQISGGFQLPEGGLSPETLAFFSPQARLASEETYYKGASPFMAPPDLGKMGYGDQGAAASSGISDARTQYQLDMESQRKARMQALNGLLGGAGMGSPTPNRRSPSTAPSGVTQPTYGGANLPTSPTGQASPLSGQINLQQLLALIRQLQPQTA